MSLGLFRKTTSETGHAPDIFCRGNTSVEGLGRDVVAICNIGVLGREWVIWFCQKGGVEVEAIGCEGVDGYGAGYIDAFAAGGGGRER